LIVIALIVLASSLGLSVSLDVYKSYNYQTEKLLVLSLLQKARNESLNNINNSAHGVYFGGGHYVLFEGINYLSRDVSKDLTFVANNLNVIGTNEIIFSQLSATTTPLTLTLSDGVHLPDYLDLNYEGSISLH
jgi:hypothetical protein